MMDAHDTVIKTRNKKTTKA